MKLFTERMNEMIVESTQNTLSSFFENPTQSAFIVPVSLFEVSIKRKTEWRNEEQKKTNTIRLFATTVRYEMKRFQITHATFYTWLY